MAETVKITDVQPNHLVADGDVLPMRSLPSSLGFKLRRLQLAYKRKYQLSTHALNIPPDQIGALSLISRNPGLTPTDLAAMLTLDTAQVTSILKQLEARGLVCRAKSASDGRSYQMRPTAEGEVEYKRLQVIIAAFEDAFISKVLSPAELAQLYSLMERLEIAAKAST